MTPTVRKRLFERAGGRCEECGFLPKGRRLLNAHHTSYPEVDTLDNLRLLCVRCHQAKHPRNYRRLPGERMTFRFTDESAATLRALALETGQTQAAILEVAIRQFAKRSRRRD